MSNESKEFDKLIQSMNSELKLANEDVKLLEVGKSKSYPLPAPFFQSPKLDSLPSNVLIAADWHPGFACDDFRWDLTIDQDGNLRQRIGAKAQNAKKTYTHWGRTLKHWS